MNRMTIVHLITELNMGGAEQMLSKLVRRMDRQTFRCIVVSMTEKGPIGETLGQQGIPVLALGMDLGRPTLQGLARLYHFLRQESVDLIQSWLYHADLLGLVVGRLAGVKRVIWGIRCSDLHLRQYRPMTALTVRACGFMSTLADAIVVNSREGQDIHAKRGYKTERMLIIPNGFDTDRFRPDESARDWLLDSLGLGPEAILIGLVARFDPMKDQPNFLRAAQLLAKEDAKAHFVMVGRGMVPHNATLRPFLDGPLRGRVHLLGLRSDIPRLTAALDIASSSSAFGEGFSNTIGEAMSCGISCVVTDVGDSAQIVANTGIVVAPEDPEALSQAWLKLLRMGKQERRQLGNRARQRIIADYEIGKIVERFEQFYQKLIRGPRLQEGA
jgi:glycosyltransferase involved in cell wall biosynthesis